MRWDALCVRSATRMEQRSQNIQLFITPNFCADLPDSTTLSTLINLFFASNLLHMPNFVT